MNGAPTHDVALYVSMGMSPAEIQRRVAEPLDVFHIWPENMDAVRVFVAMGSQWAHGMGGASGMVYASLPVVMEYEAIPEERRRDVFRDLRVMESAALSALAEKAEQARAARSA